MHRIQSSVLNGRDSVKILVVGCGGTGSAIAGGLPYLHQALVAAGREGLDVTLMDGDLISPTNCVRQPFGQQEIGLSKAVVLADRVNKFWCLDWKAIPRNLGRNDPSIPYFDIFIGCVDTRKARAAIKNSASRVKAAYWLDIGNSSAGGQFILGQPNFRGRDSTRLKTVADLYPEAVDPRKEDPDEPSCSAIEALDRQEPFVNQVLAYHALGLLARLFRHGAISYHGGFVSLETGQCSQIAA